MNDVSFEKIDRSDGGWQEGAYPTLLMMVIGGVLLLFLANGTSALIGGGGLIAVAVVGYGLVLRKSPQLRYFRYFWLDQNGIHHIEGNTPTDRTAHFTWDEILHVEVSDDEFRGLILTLTRQGMSGVPIFLTMDHPKAAAAAIREARASAHHLARNAGHPIE